GAVTTIPAVGADDLLPELRRPLVFAQRQGPDEAAHRLLSIGIAPQPRATGGLLRLRFHGGSLREDAGCVVEEAPRRGPEFKGLVRLPHALDRLTEFHQ